MSSTHKKVIVRKSDRDSISGFVAPADFVVDGKFQLLNTAGNVVAIELRDIKAVYFVREFSDAEETVTGPDGRYSLRKHFAWEIPLVIQVNGPTFTFFKGGYGLLQRRLSGDTEVMALLPAKTREERLRALRRTGDPGEVPLKYKQRLQEVIREERRFLGVN